MRSRKKTIVSAIIAVFMFVTILSMPGSSFKAEESQPKSTNHLSGYWVNPSYMDIQLQPQLTKPMRPMDVATTYTAASEPELRSVIYQAFKNRETYPQITYTGDASIFGDVDEFGNLINLNGLSDIINSIVNADDYLKFNMVSNPYSVSQVGSSCTISFIDDSTDPSNPTYISYLTTLEQEDQVDTEVTRILSAILEPGMNPHQIVKAIHDYLVLNVTYDQTLTEHSAYAGLFGEKQTVCQGYALLAYKMLTEAGLGARIVSGMADSGDGSGSCGHAWNRVLLEDKWYNLDCTWDDLDDPGKIIYSYYNLSDVELAIDHQVADEYTYLSGVDGYIYLPPANESYTTTLENLIVANPANEIYPRLQQLLGFDYFLNENTAATAEELENKIMSSFQQKDSQFRVRYNVEDDLDPITTLNEIIERRPMGTGVLSEGKIEEYNRGLAQGYWLIELALIYSTPNQPPTADPVTIDGSAKVGQTLSGVYSYTDDDIPSDPEGLSQYQWYRSDTADFNDSSKTSIPGAIGSAYTVTSRDAGKYLFFVVVPVAQTGTHQGDSAVSAASALVGSAPETVAQPTSSVAVGEVVSGTAVNLSTETALASIYYTLDGSTPTMESGILYDDENPIIIDDDTTIKAIAVKEGMLSSEVSVFAYKIAVADECFIATAAFGSKFDWPVALLRAFRDQYLLTNPIGTAFVDFYYQNSPPIAAYIAASEPLKVLVRVLLAPIIAVVYMVYHPVWLVILLLGAVTAGFFLRFRKKTA